MWMIKSPLWSHRKHQNTCHSTVPWSQGPLSVPRSRTRHQPDEVLVHCMAMLETPNVCCSLSLSLLSPKSKRLDQSCLFQKISEGQHRTIVGAVHKNITQNTSTILVPTTHINRHVLLMKSHQRRHKGFGFKGGDAILFFATPFETPVALLLTRGVKDFGRIHMTQPNTKGYSVFFTHLGNLVLCVCV